VPLSVAVAEYAAALAGQGFHIFPCLPGDKRPAVDRWEQRASADPAHVAEAWRTRFSGHNVGVACGPSRLVVLDLDCHGGLPDDWRLPGIVDGSDVLAQLCEWAGQPWPYTHWVATPSGGWHLYFRAPAGAAIRNSASLIGPQIDVRGAGGYVVGAGSTVDGQPYKVLDSQPPAPLPEWIARMLTRPHTTPRPAEPRGGRTVTPGRLDGLVRTVETAQPGQRNDALYWAACRAAELDADPGEVTGALLAAALTAGLTEHEARRTIGSAMGGGRR
jgi:Bifunctional DNA primase/polymerase, N-terminal